MGASASAIAQRYDLVDLVPSAVAAAIEDAKPLARQASGPFFIVGSSQLAAAAAASYLDDHGFSSQIATTSLSGEARVRAVEMVRGVASGVVSIATGETTVVVTGSGTGGRNQEAALAAAIEITETDIVFCAMGTDGIDGPTPAAGAVVDGSTSSAASVAGIDLVSALEHNDSYTALSGIGELVIRGETGTNVGDLWMAGRRL